MGTITRSMNSLRAGVKGNGSSCRDDSERSPLRRRRPDVLPSTLTAVSNAILKTASCLTKMALAMTARAPGAAPPRWQASHFCQSPAALMSGASSRQNLQPKHCTLLGVSHVVGRTLGSHAYRIGAGGHAFLSQFQLERLSFRGWFRSFCLLAREPGPELFILVADKFQGFGHDIGW